jgi:hypothetical protein
VRTDGVVVLDEVVELALEGGEVAGWLEGSEVLARATEIVRRTY